MKYKEGVVLEANSHLNSLNKKNSGQACVTMSADWPLFSSLKQYSNCQTFDQKIIIMMALVTEAKLDDILLQQCYYYLF